MATTVPDKQRPTTHYNASQSMGVGLVSFDSERDFRLVTFRVRLSPSPPSACK